MKQVRWTILFVVLSLTLGTFVSQASAQGIPNLVAVVDVAQLIKCHPEFKANQEALQKEIMDEEAKFRTRQQGIANKENALKASPHKPGTAEYQKMADDLTNDFADLEKDAKQMSRKFQLKSAQIMYNTFQDIKREIARYAQSRNIAQVTDYRVFEPNPADPTTVEFDMDQKLVWFNPSLDITRWIVVEMYKAKKIEKLPEEVEFNLACHAAILSGKPVPERPKTATAPQAPGGQAPAAPQRF